MYPMRSSDMNLNLLQDCPHLSHSLTFLLHEQVWRNQSRAIGTFYFCGLQEIVTCTLIIFEIHSRIFLDLIITAHWPCLFVRSCRTTVLHETLFVSSRSKRRIPGGTRDAADLFVLPPSFYSQVYPACRYPLPVIDTRFGNFGRRTCM